MKIKMLSILTVALLPLLLSEYSHASKDPFLKQKGLNAILAPGAAFHCPPNDLNERQDNWIEIEDGKMSLFYELDPRSPVAWWELTDGVATRSNPAVSPEIAFRPSHRHGGRGYMSWPYMIISSVYSDGRIVLEYNSDTSTRYYDCRSKKW